MLWSFQFALNERLVDHNLRADVGEFAFLPGFNLFCIGSKSRCIRSTPTETLSINENDFECFASTGANAPAQHFRIVGLSETW
jgi:hypothetical protein